jgi:hypothetical protein
LHRDGVVHGSGPIYKKNGQLESQGRAYSLEEVSSEFASAVARLLKRKITRCTDRSMWLLIYINDKRLPPEGLPSVLRAAYQAAQGSPFAATILVGSSDEKRICELLEGSI